MQEPNFTKVADELIQKLDCELSINEASIKQINDEETSIRFSDVVLTSFLDKMSLSKLPNESFKLEQTNYKTCPKDVVSLKTVCEIQRYFLLFK
jgi:hypothetical protein